MVTIKGMKDVKKRLLRFARNDSKEIKGDCHGNIMQKYGLAMTKKLQRQKKERRLLRFARNDGTEEVFATRQ